MNRVAGFWGLKVATIYVVARLERVDWAYPHSNFVGTEVIGPLGGHHFLKYFLEPFQTQRVGNRLL